MMLVSVRLEESQGRDAKLSFMGPSVLTLLFALIQLIFSAGLSAASAPSITSLTPTSAAVGVSVTIKGTSFGSSQGTSTVTFNGTVGTPTTWANTSIKVPVPAGATTGNVVVTVNGVPSNGVSFTVLPTPSITSLTPSSGPAGAVVTIAGTNFGATQGSSTVVFDNTTATPTAWSNTSIQVPVPTGAATGNVVVTVSGVASNGVSFTVLPTPSITSLTPTSAAVGVSVTIKGTSFGSSQGTSTVTFNGTVGTPTTWANTSIKVPVPAGATTGNVVVTVNGVPSNGVRFTVLPTPSITSLTPSSGPAGAVVTIAGTNFGATQGSSTVVFDNTTATPTAWSNTSIQVPVPTGAATGNVVVTVSGVASNGVSFTVLPTPSITSLTPTSAAVGVSVTIKGTSFGSSQGTSTVTFNGTVGTPTTWANTSIKVPVPAGATTGNVVVTVNGVPSNGVSFTVLPTPSITSLTPSSGPAGAVVTIAGTNFGATQGSSTVVFDNTTATPTAWSNTSIQVPVPTGAATGNVVVTVSGVASNGVSFTVLPTPSITSLTPTSAAVGVSVTIKGTSFGSSQGTSTVTFNGTVGTPTTWANTSIKVPVPAGATTGNVVVTVNGVPSNGVSFIVPGTTATITTLSPTSGSVGSQVSINGSYFGSSQGTNTVSFNGTLATNVVSWSSTLIVAPVPSAATSGNVVVTVGGVASNGVSFTVLPTPSITSLSPTSGAVGTSVTITGTNFGASQGTGTVTFNGTTTTPSSWSATSIVAQVPAGSTTGSVVVTVNGVPSNGMSFTVLPTPSITSLSPTSGAVGISVTITGTNFGATQATSTVSFSGTAATPTSWSSSSITVPVPSGATTGSVVVTVGGVASNGISFTVQSGGFVATSGQMEAARYGQTATQLTSGQVLIGGGINSSGALNEAEIYTLTSQTFAAISPMNVARWLHTATLLNDGTVLIAGGSSVSNETTLNSAEIYDPVAGTFTLLQNTLNTARVGHTASLLSNGQVLIVGGYDPTTGIISDAELYDPTAQIFIDLGNTNTPRFHHTATLLQNGQVLIAGGETDPTPSGAYNTAEIFNPLTWTFTALSVNMTTAREGHAATLLNNGQVLVTGGDLPGAGSLNTAEMYNPVANTFTAVSSTMTSPRIYHDANLLNGGTVLLSGGENDSGGDGTALNTAEVYNPTSATFAALAGNMTSVREHQTATLLNNGTVLEDGGTDGTNIFNTAEIYTASQLTSLASIAVSPATPSVPVGTQQLLVATGTFSDGSTQILSSVLWSSSSSSVFTVSNDASDTGFATSIGLGNATVTATAAGISGSTTVTVPTPTLVSITLSPQGIAMPLGTTQQFTATGTYSDGSIQDLTSTATWTSSSTAATVNSAGLVTAVVSGSSTIQASSGSQNSSTTVTVGSPVLVSIALTPPSATVAVGTSQQYQVSGTYTDGSTQNLTSSVTWSSVPVTTASITGSGLATGVGHGTANITAASGTVATAVTLTVGAPSVVSISVVPNATSIPAGSSLQFNATGTFSDGSVQDITSSATWTSSNPSAASLSGTGLASALANGSSTIAASYESKSGSAVLTVATGSVTLNTSRYQHNATLLNNGTVLVAGGTNCPSAGSCSYLDSAELYSPASGTITNTGAMAAARTAPAVLLGNGKVLIAGGYSCDSSGNCASLKSVEIYDPVAGTFSSAGNMTIDRYAHTMTLLNSGQVLIAGGETCTSSTSCTALNSAELYNPVAGTFTATGSLSNARFNATAAALGSDKVLIAGGFNGTNFPAVAELYNPTTGTFSTTGSLNTPRESASATLLDNGQVMIAGGSTCNSPGCPTAVTELFSSSYFYYPTYPTGNMTVPRFDETATVLTNGQIFLAGGYDSCSSNCTSDETTELFDPMAYTFASGQGLSTGRSGHTATLLTDGNVLLVGGINNGVTLSSTDSYQPVSLAPSGLASIVISPSNPPVVVGSTLTLTATGYNSYGSSLYGSQAPPLQSVVWNSSSPSVATVSNAAGSSGIVNALSSGTTTITGTAGTITASIEVTATASLVSIAISPSNPTVSIDSTQTLQLTATGTYSDGSTLALTSDVSWASSNSSVATVFDIPGSPAVVVPALTGSTNITAAFGGVTGSTTVTVNMPLPPAPPIVTAVSPTSGVAGTQVTITGAGFGATQGSGIVWLGSTVGSVVSWSDSQVVATVSTGSTSGVAQVQQNGSASNSTPFTISTAAITSVSPNNGLAGTQVTISGSGFGATQGSGSVWLGTVPAIVGSWSDSQVVATVATGAATGNAMILQNGVLSNAIPFTINLPQITGITPNTGSAGTVVTITGVSFGGTQGSGNVWIGSTYGSVIGWSDTQVTASVAANAVSGIVKIEQNGVWSNTITFTVPPILGSGTSVTLVPNEINMLVGSTQPIQALDSSGQSVTGLTWISSNPAVATLSTDDPPIITAVAAGNTTITAGNAATDVNVFTGSTLAPNTLLWSNPGDGFGVISIVPAVPSSTGVADVFATQADGSVQAVTSGGTTAWTTANVSGNLVPDFQGGLVVNTGQSIYRLDGMTGKPSSWTYNSVSGNNLPTPVVHTNGTIFTIDGQTIVGINPTTGNQAFSPIQLESSTSASSGSSNQCSSPLPPGGSSSTSPPVIGNLIIAGDGNAYVMYRYDNSQSVQMPVPSGCGEAFSASGTDHLHLMRVGSGGDSYEFSLGDRQWAESSYYENDGNNGVTSYSSGSSISAAYPFPNLITNGSQGVLATYALNTRPISGNMTSAFYVATTSDTQVTTNVQVTSVPGQATPVQPVLQRADGSYIGTVGIGSPYITQYNMIAFTSSGSTLWTGPNDTPGIATSGGGVIGSSGTTYDPNGNITGQVASLIQSWKGAYGIGSVESFYALLTNIESDSYAAVAGGNFTGNGTATQLATIGLFWCGSGYGEAGACTQVNAPDVQWKYLQLVNSNNFGKGVDFSVAEPNSPAHTDWVNTIQAAALDALTQAFAQFPVTVRRVSPRKGAAWECLLSLHLPGCTVFDKDTDRVYVSGVYPGDGATGETIGITPLSFVYYWISLQNSESFLSLNPPFPPKTSADNSAFAQLLQGIGRGIGNAAAHELGHHVEYTFTINMDCPTKYGLPCAGNDGVVFERDGGYSQEYKSTYPAIKWQPNSVCAIEQYYNGDQLDPNIGCTVNYKK